MSRALEWFVIVISIAALAGVTVLLAAHGACSSHTHPDAGLVFGPEDAQP